ncbi:MAG: hypothetical protein JO322_09530 [Candidatus Eremiobacteraeota bacterium]|nr:hypothetical protein [Candidatus Eremiobacteraeota bacterium]
MIQALGVVLIFATIAAVIVTALTTLFERRGTQIAAGAVFGGWVGFLVDVTTSGALKATATVPALFVVPFAVAAVAMALSPTARERLLDIPRRFIIGANIFRSIGFLFVALAFAGRLDGPFPYSAGIGDIVVGLLAIPLTLGEPRLTRTDSRLAVWNALGLFDLVTAVALGMTSLNGSPLQLIHAGVGSDTILQLPWSLIPLFLVPCFMIGHIVLFAQMRSSARRVEIAGAASTS